MKPLPTTITLAVFALLSLITSISVHFLTLPGADRESELIGEVFYPEFTEPDQAASLELIIWDDEEKKTKNFEIKKVDELWTIPSYDDYPVESAEQLIDTAGSVINIKREYSAGKGADTHARFGVIDPNDPEAKLKESNQIGDRIVLKDDSGNVVCDLIIGNAEEEASTSDQTASDGLVKGKRYYVRQPGEDQTFVAELNLQISTDFENWIETDLLQVADASVKQLLVRTYDVENKKIEITGGEPFPMKSNESELILEKEGMDWKLDGLNEATETLDASPISTLSNDLKSLKIIHVERKPVFQDSNTPVLNGDLTANLPKGLNTRSEMRVTQESWSVITPYGFLPSFADGKTMKSLTVLSSSGEFDFSTDAGLVYHLKFGGDVKLEKDKFEFAAAKSEMKKDAAAEENEGDDADNEAKEENEPADGPNVKKGKIMSVHVTFDESLIEKPTPPVKPMEPVKPVKPNEEKADGDKAKQPSSNEPPESVAPTDLKQDGQAKDSQPKSDQPMNTPEKEIEPAKIEPAKEKSEGEKAGEAVGNDEENAGSGCGSSFDQEESEKQEAAKEQETAKPETKEATADSKPDDSKPADGKNDPTPESKQDADKTESKTDSNETAAGKQEADPTKTSQEKPEEKKPTEFDLAMEKYNSDMQQYQTDLATYEAELEQYKKDLEAYEKKVKDNKQKVENLNQRFGDWFYVVDAQNLSKLKLVRADVVKPKEKTDGDANSGDLKIPGANELPPGLRNPSFNTPPPSGQTGPAKSEAEKTESSKSETPPPSNPPTKSPEKAEPKKGDSKDGDKANEKITSPKPVPPGPSPTDAKESAELPKKSDAEKAAGEAAKKKDKAKG